MCDSLFVAGLVINNLTINLNLLDDTILIKHDYHNKTEYVIFSMILIYYIILARAGLPDEPKVVRVVVVDVPDYGRTLIVEWTPPAVANGHVTYLVQERHHVGAEYVPERMTAWTIVTRTDRVREHLKLYAPGRWFQFRVAAINENGTRGYSPPSEQFFVQLGPRE